MNHLNMDVDNILIQLGLDGIMEAIQQAVNGLEGRVDDLEEQLGGVQDEQADLVAELRAS